MATSVPQNLEQCLIEHEGLKNYAYTDTTGNITIGIGRNISHTGPGLSNDECLSLLRNDIDRVTKQLSAYSWFKNQDKVRQDVLIELAFNLGLAGLLTFKKTLVDIESKNYKTAADDLMQSKWAKQVGINRVTNICKRLITGSYV